MPSGNTDLVDEPAHLLQLSACKHGGGGVPRLSPGLPLEDKEHGVQARGAQIRETPLAQKVVSVLDEDLLDEIEVVDEQGFASEAV